MNDDIVLPDLARLPFKFDSVKLKEELIALENEYCVGHFVRQNYEGDWAILPLTAQSGKDHHILMASAIPGDHEFIFTPFLLKTPKLLKSTYLPLLY
ncbi:hypothetical protein [Algoriphagus sediminis]|uniref:Uncharacterized protein n=1 Tax=Algoriphagus sediminis TaxID=3057113 RepID=A0ABT7Y7K2_9BACT|nr:hypothetical protein [Algoriphagus sediminis]MDN3202506.1 hypothetical protein [Algoriphagus sediminis]